MTANRCILWLVLFACQDDHQASAGLDRAIHVWAIGEAVATWYRHSSLIGIVQGIADAELRSVCNFLSRDIGTSLICVSWSVDQVVTLKYLDDTFVAILLSSIACPRLGDLRLEDSDQNMSFALPVSTPSQ